MFWKLAMFSYYLCFTDVFILFNSEKPKLHLDGLYGKVIRVKAGDPLSINVPLTGSPAPTTTWTINDKPLPFSNRILADSGEDYVGLKIPMTQRSDSGKYTITAKNDYGEDSADMTVLVYGMFYLMFINKF